MLDENGMKQVAAAAPADASNRYAKNWNPADHYKDEEIATAYDRSRFTSPIGRLFDRLERRRIRAAFAALPPGARIVDVPCGTGRLAEELLEAGYAVEGYDISPQMLAVAARRLARFGARFLTRVEDVRLIAGSGPVADGVLCARVLMHFPYEEQIAFLRNVASLTDGPIVFTQGVLTPWHRLRRILKRLLGNQAPASFALTPTERHTIFADAGLAETSYFTVLPILSESRVFVARKASRAP